MGQDDRPEDEAPEGPEAGEPGGLSIFGNEPEEEEPASPDVQEEPEPADEGPASPDVQEEPEPGLERPAVAPVAAAGPRRPRRRRGLKVGLVLLGIFAMALVLVGWNRVAASDRLCSSCHEMRSAVQSAQRSVHADVPCLACHSGTGLAGAVRYVPTLTREAITEFTPWDMAHGVLDARPCDSCHTDISSTPQLAAAHKDSANCASCHGNVAHPPFRLAGFEQPAVQPSAQPTPTENPHPGAYVQTHGDDVVNDPGSCYTCHETNYCQTCHFRETYPHPKDWMNTHGQVQEQQGIDACSSCHPSTFCAGCHGTQIPHASTWLGEHWRSLQDSSTAPCMVCHPTTDCTQCHSRHSVHQTQDLYT